MFEVYPGKIRDHFAVQCARVSVDQGGRVSDEQRDDRDELEAEAAPAEKDRGDADPEPDFELHGQFFHAPSE